jgi:putative transposase
MGCQPLARIASSLNERQAAVAAESTTQPADLLTPTGPDWEEARRRYALIEPILGNTRTPRAVLQERANKAGVNVTALYRLAQTFRASGLLSSLLPFKPSGGRGKSRLRPDVEKLLKKTIEEHFLTKQQRSICSTATEIRRRCLQAKLAAPHPNTVRLRIIAIPESLRLSRRAHRKEAQDRFAPRPGVFDAAQHPLDIVQIDHTKLDIIIVDEQQRLPIGRPWITLAIDVFSRMVVGLYASLDPPGAVSTGLCIANAVLPKEAWLINRGIVGRWPCRGFPSRIHLDNAKEFHGEMLRRACEQYGITLEYRPVAQPHMGGHIERLLGTLLRALHELPGATFSHPKQRGQYDSDASAVMTLGELERWLAEYIVCVYHEKLHGGITMTPMHRWMIGDGSNVENSAEPLDEERIRLDFMPFVERTVQPYGVLIDGIHYYHDVLRRFIGSSERKKKRSFIFRRDPRDVSTIYFWDPELYKYSPIAYRNTAHPPMSVWELREIRRKLIEAGRSNADEEAIFEAYTRLREREARSANETKRARQQRERRLHTSPTIEQESIVDTQEPIFPAYRIEDIKPFEIEDI